MAEPGSTDLTQKPNAAAPLGAADRELVRQNGGLAWALAAFRLTMAAAPGASLQAVMTADGAVTALSLATAAAKVTGDLTVTGFVSLATLRVPALDDAQNAQGDPAGAVAVYGPGGALLGYVLVSHSA